MLKLMMATRGNEDQSIMGGTVYSKGTVNQYDLDSAILNLDESKVIQMNFMNRDRGDSIQSGSMYSYNPMQN